jgi:hypothetical protein
LRQSISERERQRFSTIAEHAKRREKVDSAIFNLLKADPHTKDIQKTLKKSHDKFRSDLTKRIRTAPELAYDIIGPSPGPEGEPQFLVVPPYSGFTANYQDNSTSSSDEAGNLAMSFITPESGGNSWAWAGVGFPLVPDQDRTFKIEPVFFCRFAFGVDGFLGFNAHIEGSTLVHVHRYDRDWQDTGEVEDYPWLIFSHTSETQFFRPDPGMEVHDEPRLVNLRGDSNYLIWASLVMSGNASFWSIAGGHFRAQCISIWVNPPW